jgi:magnesium transporter
MHSEDSAEVLVQLKDMRALRILGSLEPDDAVYIVRQLDPEDRDRLLSRLPIESARAIYDLLAYAHDTAGGVMTPHVNKVRTDWTVDEAIQMLRTEGGDNENLDTIYATDSDGKLEGSVTLHRLILAKGNQRIAQILEPHVHGACHADDPAAQAAQTMAEFGVRSVPVLDSIGRLIGMITHDDVIDILQERATKDIQILHGAGADENIHDSVAYSVARRNPWLLVNLVTAAMGALIVSLFRGQIEQLALLAVFMTINTSLGANAGGQTLAVAIRSIALGEWRRGDLFPICIREGLKGLLNGFITGIVAGTLGAVFMHNVRWGLAIALAMTLTMGLCGIAGALIPYGLRRMKCDPAQSASIFLTMITDTAGMYIFLTLGCWLLL